MNLRQARIDDHWRRLFQREFSTKLTSLEFERLACLADGSVNFSGGISAIVGSNGVGKSTLIAAIAELLNSDEGKLDPAQRERVRGSILRGAASHGPAVLALGIDEDVAGLRTFVGDAFTGECRFLDPSGFATRCVDQIHNDQNFDDLLESVTPLSLDSDDLEIASYLVGKVYAAISIAEISDYAGLDRFPYFQVQSGGVPYGSEGMGRGELALLLTYWILRDVPKNSVLILEEPETHVSPRSQECLMNILAKFALEKGIWIIVATHSPTIISRIPNVHASLLVRNSGSAVVFSNPSHVDIMQLLGGGVTFQGVLAVEDEAARDILTTLLEQTEPDLTRQLEIVVAGSEANITTLLETMPVTREWFTLVGVYDGDMRSQTKGKTLLWPYTFMPGTTPPERPLIEMAQTAPGISADIAIELTKPERRIQIALNAAEGADHHDYFQIISRSLATDVSSIRRGFTRIWARRPEIGPLVETLAQELKAALNFRRENSTH